MMQVSRAEVRLGTIRGKELQVLHRRGVESPLRRVRSGYVIEDRSERELRLQVVSFNRCLV